MKPLSRTVIVADNDLRVVKPLISELEKHYSVRYAASIDNTLLMLEKTQAPLIVLDYDFQDPLDRTGLEIVPELQSIRPGLIIFLLTNASPNLIGNPDVDRVMYKDMLTADLAQVSMDVDMAFRPRTMVASGKYAGLVAQVAEFSPNSDEEIYRFIEEQERAERLESRKKKLERMKRQPDIAKSSVQVRDIGVLGSEVEHSRSCAAKRLVRSLCDSNGWGAVFTELFREDVQKLVRENNDVYCQAFKKANRICAGNPRGEVMRGSREVRETDVGHDYRLFHSNSNGQFVFTHLWKKNRQDQEKEIKKARTSFENWAA
jgi:putative component of toxin-antitoxin plasmid stabilization module